MTFTGLWLLGFVAMFAVASVVSFCIVTVLFASIVIERRRARPVRLPIVYVLAPRRRADLRIAMRSRQRIPVVLDAACREVGR